MVEKAEIVKIHRDMWLAKYIDTVHNDDLEEMKIVATVIYALTQCYWDVFHDKVTIK